MIATLKAYVWLIGAAVVAVIAAGCFAAGYHVRSLSAERDAAKIVASQNAAVADAQAQARAKEKENAELHAKVDSQYFDLANAQVESSNLRADLAAGRRRLSVRTTGTCTSGVPANPAAAGLDDGAARADIDPADAVNIITITSEGDDAIRQLTALQQWAAGIGQQK